MSHYDRLDAAMGEARLDRGLSWSELADEVGVSESALRNIRKGRNGPSDLTKRRLEDTLLWVHGSVDAVLAGGEPTPIEPAPRPLSPKLDRNQLRETARQLRQQADDLDRLSESLPD